jgi:hypothetical protein
MMTIKIKADTLQALDDWKAGKPLRTLELGHIHRMQENPGMSATIDHSTHIGRDQLRAHEYCFKILAFFATAGGVPDPFPYEVFTEVADATAKEFPDLKMEERIGAESLAWKTLVVGWRKAIDGHKDVEYIEVKREG